MFWRSTWLGEGPRPVQTPVRGDVRSTGQGEPGAGLGMQNERPIQVPGSEVQWEREAGRKLEDGQGPDLEGRHQTRESRVSGGSDVLSAGEGTGRRDRAGIWLEAMVATALTGGGRAGGFGGGSGGRVGRAVGWTASDMCAPRSRLMRAV